LKIKPEIIILLLLFYAFFVIGDVLTTFWLIKYYPGGISGEMNPVAYMLFTKYGYAGMLASKIVFFVVSSTVFILLYMRYGGARWIREALEITILGLTGLSILVIINNIFSILATYIYLYNTPPLWLLKILVFLMTVTVACLGALLLFKDPVRVVEALLGSIMAMLPLFIWPRLDPMYYLIYLGSLFLLIALSTYFIGLKRLRR